MEPRKYAYIDSLRGLAILFVVMVHAGQYGAKTEHFPSWLAAFVESGKYGVQLFFLVSAYTLMLSHRSRQTEQDHLFRFFVRRFFRVAPLYYAAVLYYVSGRASAFHFSDFRMGRIPVPVTIANLFFAHGIQPDWINRLVPGGWSITVEMTFYLVLPLVTLFVKNLNQSVWLLLFSLVVRQVAESLAGSLPPMFRYYYFPNQFPVFCLGITAYFAAQPREALRPLTLLLLGLAIVWLSVEGIPPHFVYASAFALLLLALRQHPYRLLVNPFFTFLGKISFSVYLIHFIVLHWLVTYRFVDYLPVTDARSAVLNFLLRYSVLLGISAAVSTLTYYGIEQPFMKLGKRWLQGRKEKVVAGV